MTQQLQCQIRHNSAGSIWVSSKKPQYLCCDNKEAKQGLP